MSTIVVKSEYVSNERHEDCLDQSIPCAFVTPTECQYIPTHDVVHVVQQPVSFTEGSVCQSIHDPSFVGTSTLLAGDPIQVLVEGPFLDSIPDETNDINCYLELCPDRLFTPDDQKDGDVNIKRKLPSTNSSTQKTPNRSELRSQRRRQCNREYARRARSRKKKKLEKLHRVHEELKAEQRQWTLNRETMECQHERLQLDLLQERNTNELLRAEVCQIEREIHSLEHTLKIRIASPERRHQLEHT